MLQGRNLSQEQTQYTNPYGYFDKDQAEYVITRPDTPTPWINYLGKGRYGGIISNTAGGYSFDRDPRNRRVTRYRYNGIPIDQPGRYIYLRDRETGVYWSPTWQPVVERKLEDYECRHGAGYTRISSTYHEIKAEILYFVPSSQAREDCPCELWILKIKNNSSQVRHLNSFSYIEFSYIDAAIDQQNLDWGAHIVQSKQTGGIIYASTKFRPTTTFFSSNRELAGFDTDREVFIGNYHDLSNPEKVLEGKSGSSQAPRGNSIGSLCHTLILEPAQEIEIIYILGITDQQESIQAVVDFYCDPQNAREAFQALKIDWSNYLQFFSVSTPDAELNAMLNFWNPLQCRTTLYWSRFVSAYETGMGRGMGTRDSAQDTLGTVHAVGEHVRDLLSRLWRLQFLDGHTWHQFYPLTGEGGPGLASEFPDWPQWFCDDHLWLVIAVCAYLRETGDFTYLEQQITYWDGKEVVESVWDHMLRAVNFTLNHRGPHGLPRLGFSDWDDTMNLDHGSGKAESVWCGEQFCRAMLDMQDLCLYMHKDEEASHFKRLYQEMARIISRTAWDGKWYARAYDDQGNPVGIEGEVHHKIGLISQIWAVIGEVDREERLSRAMESVHELLNSPYGLMLMSPPYDGSDPRVRGTSTYPPGAKENGGIFCHANAWAIIAAAKLGQADQAYQYYRQILPLARTDADVYQSEPYVYCQNICGPDHPQYGRGRNAWLTGTASWTYVAGVQWILGIRSTYNGLMVSPAIPSLWKGFEAIRIFRDVTYKIKVERGGPGEQSGLVVDGNPVEGNIIPLPSKRSQEVNVRLIL
ncbi:MAG: glycosyl transferase family 36 [Anaerolineaceae bacterium]|jgi:cellobiose phosphorylase